MQGMFDSMVIERWGDVRVIINPCQTVGVYMGIAVAAGTRHELPHESGMAHFTEHMTFKGTRKRTAMQIINSLEGVGGELNAFTGKEETVYYCSVQPKHISRALELLTDIVFSSTYPEVELHREAEVVIDEIESYNDSPSELIFDEFEAMLFANHPLGRNILGDADALRCHNSEDMTAFARRLYLPERAVLFVYGNVNVSRVMRCLQRLGTPTSAPTLAVQSEHTSDSKPTPLSGMPTTPQTLVVPRSVHQAHVMMGARTIAVTHPDRMALIVLNNILGGPALNSRLNLTLRERSGLVYTVESNYTGYTDMGVWSIYFGCDHHDVKRCCQLVTRELDRLVQHPLSDTQLNKAKRQMCGQLALSYDQHESIATGMGKTFLHHNVYRTMPEIIERINAITPQQLLDVAQRNIAPTLLTTLIYSNKER